MSSQNPAATAQELLQRNEKYAQNHQPELLLSETPENAPKPKTFIFCCFDPRLQPEKVLGLDQWDALVIRNAGGAVAPALPSLIALDYFFGSFEDILIIQHTDCGKLHLTESEVKQNLKDHHRGSEDAIDDLHFDLDLTLEDRVRQNVKLIKESPHIRDELKERTKGLIYDIKTGKLAELH
ncbi:hypothetical protein N0V93_004224 [Gnomoniopsis smithogilvyi]|uniref:Carbonic anhydrase n=1 Tax=Gnomoniopsis smithogilvyi TaxID=1191159 RepID=A0A9W8YUA7_9PEZI|nr:hypothetical protein N0V93_004224 [Gnomoniopsis smithogilvyi]